MNFNVAFRPSPMAVVFTIGALALSLLGSVPPARRAARLNIIEAVSVE
jgi:putative ABC transport system permease protein